MVLRRLRAAAVAHRLHAHDQAPDRLPHASCRRRAVDCDAAPQRERLRRRRRRTSIPTTGFYITDTLDSETRSATSRSYTIAREDQLRRDAGEPGPAQLDRAAGRARLAAASSARRPPARHTTRPHHRRRRAWTSKLNDSKTEVEARRRLAPLDARQRRARSDARRAAAAAARRRRPRHAGPRLGGETRDDAAGLRRRQRRAIRTRSSRTARWQPRATRSAVPARSAATSRSAAAARLGDHPAREGGSAATRSRPASTSRTTSRAPRACYSGGAFIQNFVGERGPRHPLGRSSRRPSTTDPRFDQTCTTPDPNGDGPSGGTQVVQVRLLGGTVGSPGTQVGGKTINWAAYLRDSWQSVRT